MTRFAPRPFCLPILLLLGLGWNADLAAQTVPSIEQVRVGLPSGGESGRSRRGAWSPIYVVLQAGREGVTRGQYRLVVQASDQESTPYRYTVDIPAIGGEQQVVVVGYFRPTQFGNDIDLRIQTSDGKTVAERTHAIQDTLREIVGSGALLFTSLGSPLTGLKRSLLPEGVQANIEEADLEDRGAKRFASVEEVRWMPDHWIGYDSTDLLVMTTHRENFVKDLIADTTGRRLALLEWVRRGGRLVISVGKNHQLVAEMLDKMPGLIDCTLEGSRKRSQVVQLRAWAEENKPLENVEIAELRAGPGTSVLITEPANRDDPSDRPLLLQASCGMGRVLLIGIDVDTEPFTSWTGRGKFWSKLTGELTPRIEARAANQPLGFDDVTNTSKQEILTELQRGMETFPEVPVISFGWVALFILFYILLVGPIDYFILKKVFKRLELTWITFPATVILISVLAYFTAYYVKGDELRINKVDLIDVDLHSPQVYGTTWLTIFSPRINSYTVGIEPAPAWTGPPPAGEQHHVAISPLASPDRESRLGAESIFPRPYDYADQASGMRRIPIPVWATKTFHASWRAPLDRDRPMIEAEIDYSRLDKDVPRGKIVNNLPVALEDVTLFYRGHWFNLGTLAPGESRRVEGLFEAGRRGQTLDRWFNEDVLRPRTMVNPENDDETPLQMKDTPYDLIKSLAFFAEMKNQKWYNSGVRGLDQSWRLQKQPRFPPRAEEHFRDEIVLVARLTPMRGNADIVNAHGSNPAHVWLDYLPGEVSQRPQLRGFLNQETYLRVFIPIRESR